MRDRSLDSYRGMILLIPQKDNSAYKEYAQFISNLFKQLKTTFKIKFEQYVQNSSKLQLSLEHVPTFFNRLIDCQPETLRDSIVELYVDQHL
ncbi:MAG: hypothetical protein EZS28_040168 [Streblomastix strix]|uniref:Uncharacterized protein n=1 Tax=Streblomastix strix TaxID=222440 RepID=A0A5J4U0R9_9EUKA|nr:MAG: hypothetical protein EZS28_040168 [Streblomastix strix]